MHYLGASCGVIQHTDRRHYVIHALLTVVDGEGNIPAEVVKATLHGGDAIFEQQGSIVSKLVQICLFVDMFPVGFG